MCARNSYSPGSCAAAPSTLYIHIHRLIALASDETRVAGCHVLNTFILTLTNHFPCLVRGAARGDSRAPAGTAYRPGIYARSVKSTRIASSALSEFRPFPIPEGTHRVCPSGEFG